MSYIPVRVSASLAPAMRLLHSAAPESFRTNGCEDIARFVCLEADVAREPVRLWAEPDGEIVASTLLLAGAKASVAGAPFSCGWDNHQRIRLFVSLAGRPQWNADYTTTLQSTFTLGHVDQCNVSVLNIPKTDEVRDAIVSFSPRITRAIDAAARDLAQASARLAPIWADVQRPFDLGDGMQLLIRPSGIRLSPLQGAGGSVRIVGALEARPVLQFHGGNAGTTLGDGMPEAPPAIPLPPLTTTAPTDSVFRLVGEVAMSYAELSERLTAALEGTRESIHVPFWPDPKVEVRSVEVVAVGDTLFAGVDVTGSVKGRVVVRGRAAVDSTGRAVTLLDVSAAAGGLSGLAGRAERLMTRLVDGAVRRTLEGRVLDLAPQALRAQRAINQQLTRNLGNGWRLTGSVDAPSILGYYSTSEELRVLLRATGQLDVTHASVAVPAAPELLWVEVEFETTTDNKDASEYVTLYLLRDGQEVLRREVGRGYVNRPGFGGGSHL